MATLPTEALSLVLSRLTHVQDIFRCSLVCRAWARAGKDAEQETLVLVQLHSDPRWAGMPRETADAQGLLKWLQRLQLEGRLKSLKKLRLSPASEIWFPEPLGPSALSQGLLILAGLWQLHEVSLVGSFTLKSALALLPKTILILNLWPDSAPDKICLADFKRFKQLQALELAVGEAADDATSFVGSSLVLDCCMSSLTYLCVHNRVRCTLSSDLALYDLLPNVTQLSVQVTADRDGLGLADKILQMKELRKLKLLLYGSVTSKHRLIIPSDSLLEQLQLVGPVKSPCVFLSIPSSCVHGLRYKCQNVSEISAGDALEELDAVPRNLLGSLRELY